MPGGADQRDVNRKAAGVRGSLDRLYRFLEKLVDNDFYGKIVVSFQHGKVHDVRIEQTKKLEEL